MDLSGIRETCFLLSTGVLLAIHWWSFFYSIKVSTVAIGLLTFASYPVFVTFCEPLIFKEKLRLFDVATAFSIGIGLVIVIPAYEFSNQVTQGVIWGIVSGFTFALLSLANRKLTATRQPMVVTFYQNLFAFPAFLPFAWVSDFQFTLLDFILLPILGILCTAIAFSLFVTSLSLIKARLVSVITGLEPVYGILFAFLILKEIPSIRTIIGGIIILGTIGAATKARHD